MFKVELSNPNILKTSFAAISSIIDELQIRADMEGMRLDALDNEHIIFVRLILKQTLFDQYQCDEPERICIDAGEFMNILKRAKTNDVVVLELDDGNFIIKFKNEATRTFKIRLIDMEYESPQPPKIKFPVILELPFDLLKDMVADVKLYSNIIFLYADEDTFKASGNGNLGETIVKYIHGERVREVVKSQFFLNQVKKLLKADKLSDTVVIGIGTDIPLSLNLKTVTGDAELGFILAPRIKYD